MVNLSSIRGQNTASLLYVRPSQWLTLPALSNGVQMLKAVSPGNNFFVIRVTCTGDFTVNWGDGNTINYPSNTTVSYNYDYSTISAGTEFRGYRQVLIQVTGTNITAVTLNLKHANTAANIANESGLLDLQLEIPTLTSLGIGASGTAQQMHQMMEQVYIGNNACTSFSALLQNVTSLVKATIHIPSVAGVSMANAFNTCRMLREIYFIGDTGARINNLNLTFATCTALVKAPWLNTGAVTNWIEAFSGCVNLKFVPLYNKTGGTMQGVFTGCTSLETVPLWNTTGNTSFLDAFNGCTNLRTVPLFDTASATAFRNTFTGCRSLESIPLFNTGSCTDFREMFFNCSALKTIPLLNTASGTNFQSMFNSCTNLTTIPALVTTNGTNVQSMFSGCRALKNIPNLNFAAVSSATNSGSIFSSCTSLSVGATTGLRFAVSYANCQLSQTELVAVFNGLGTASGTQAITITGNPGAAGLTQGERDIAINKGWTITG